MLTEDVFTHASTEQASSDRATIEAEHRACIEPQHRASIELSASTIEHRGRGSDRDAICPAVAAMTLSGSRPAAVKRKSCENTGVSGRRWLQWSSWGAVKRACGAFCSDELDRH